LSASVCVSVRHADLLVLLNILIALFNQAYSVVTGVSLCLGILRKDHAVDEFLALFSNKTLEYIRAPDENTFCPPYNLIKMFLILPTAPFLKKSTYQRLNEMVMKVVFFPSLCLIAFYESQFSLYQKFNLMTDSKLENSYTVA
jgi:hypothetical protein